MEFASKYIDSFSDLFRGNQSSYGVHVPEKDLVEGVKAKGKSFTKTGRMSHDDYLKHLHGESSFGVVPLDAQGNIRFAVIDVDVYPLNPKAILRTIKKASLPFVGFRSKSGGLHLYCFFSEDTPASKALPLLQEARQLLGLKWDTEIFPKQARLVGEQKGNWINIPYYKYKDTERYAYDLDGNQLGLQEALTLSEDSKITLKGFQEVLKTAPMAQAPPCLQTIFLQGGSEETRNIFLFNCATYLKARFGQDFAENLHLLNSHTDDPVEYSELDLTMIASHNKGDYSYQCNDAGLAQYCNKAMCASREYGKGSGAVSDLSFEKLIQVRSSTPYYKWFVNGAEMSFYSEAELMNQNKFRELCLRYLHKLPARLKDDAWNNVLNRALDNLELQEVEAEDDLSEDSLWTSKVVEFFSRREAMRPSQVEDGLVWRTDGDILHFKGAKLLEYLDKTRLFSHFHKAQHRNLLDELGATKSKLRYSDLKKSGRTWVLDLKELHDKGVFLDVEQDDVEFENALTPLDFIGEEKY